MVDPGTCQLVQFGRFSCVPSGRPLGQMKSVITALTTCVAVNVCVCAPEQGTTMLFASRHTVVSLLLVSPQLSGTAFLVGGWGSSSSYLGSLAGVRMLSEHVPLNALAAVG